MCREQRSFNKWHTSVMGGQTSVPIVSLPEDRVFIVTGANSGLGYQITKWTAMMGATVIMATRSEDKTNEAIKQMNEEFAAEKSRGTKGLSSREQLSLEYMHLDLSSFKSVVDFADAFKATGRQLHVLFCNAGLGLGPYAKTDDGLEMLLQVNYLGHFLLTAKLLPVIKTSGRDVRVLFMSSITHRYANFDIKTVNYSGSPDSYPSLEYYGRSKLYQVMQMFSMVDRLKDSNITVNSIHPGLVVTRFGRDASAWYFKMYLCCGKAFGVHRDALSGARCSIDSVVNPKLQGVTGRYFVDCKDTTPSRTARNKAKQEQLWRYSMETVAKYLTSEEITSMEGTGS